MYLIYQLNTNICQFQHIKSYKRYHYAYLFVTRHKGIWKIIHPNEDESTWETEDKNHWTMWYTFKSNLSTD